MSLSSENHKRFTNDILEKMNRKNELIILMKNYNEELEKLNDSLEKSLKVYLNILKEKIQLSNES